MADELMLAGADHAPPLHTVALTSAPVVDVYAPTPLPVLSTVSDVPNAVLSAREVVAQDPPAW
jgi:hypothetical protein